MEDSAADSIAWSRSRCSAASRAEARYQKPAATISSPTESAATTTSQLAQAGVGGVARAPRPFALGGGRLTLASPPSGAATSGGPSLGDSTCIEARTDDGRDASKSTSPIAISLVSILRGRGIALMSVGTATASRGAAAFRRRGAGAGSAPETAAVGAGPSVTGATGFAGPPSSRR